MKKPDIHRSVLGVLLSLVGCTWGADFTIGLSQAKPGGRVLLPVSLSGPSAPVAMQFDVIYGDDTLASEPVVKGPTTFNHTVKSTEKSNGRRRVLIYAAPLLEIPDGVIIEIPFTITGKATGAEAVSLDDILVAAASGSPIANPTVTPGQVAIEAPPDPGTSPRLSDITVSDDGTFAFGIVGPEGATYEVEVSPDLTNWSPLATTTVDNGVAPVIDPTASTQAKRFYRVIPQP